jgi:hypothetical protein
MFFRLPSAISTFVPAAKQQSIFFSEAISALLFFLAGVLLAGALFFGAGFC